MEIKERFDAKWTPEPFSGCWLWTGTADSRGYGRMVLKGALEKAAHRISWTLYRGAIPHGLWVLHKCDTPACVNPDHLFVGTPYDNTQDCISKGRLNPGRQIGVRNGRCKLSELQVWMIRDSTLSQQALAKQFGVSKTAIRYIKHARNWRYL